MNERDIFLAALDIEDSAARREFLERACQNNGSLRDSVEALFVSHESTESFLQTPLVQVPPGTPVEIAPVDSDGSTPIDVTVRLSAEQLNVEETDDDGPELGFLSPSTKPGSLGQLAHYQILEVLGKGAFGTVVKGFDEKLHRMVAIKVMSSQLASTSPARKRFLREARSAAAIRHDNVVAIYAVEEKPLPYLVMDYIPGQTLQQLLDGSGPLDLTTILQLGQQMADGLAAAHSQGLVHRDIKPANILLEAGVHLKVKITDFGLARAADDATLTQSGIIAGTPMYMSPEQAYGSSIDQRSDLFSLGSVLYQMVTGRPPFRAATTLAVLKRVTEDTPRAIQEIIPETPDWLVAIILKLLAKKPDERFQSTSELAELLARCRDELKHNGKVTSIPELIPAPPARTTENGANTTVRTSSKSRGRQISSLAVAALVIVGAVVLLLNLKSTPSSIGLPQVSNSIASRTDVQPNMPKAGTPNVQGAGTHDEQETSKPIVQKTDLHDMPGDGAIPVIALAAAAQAKSSPAEPATRLGLPDAYTNSIGMEFVNVPKGKSWLGGGKDRLGEKEAEISSDFQLGKYEVTQGQWEKVMGENPSYFSRTGAGMDEVKDIGDEELKRFPVDSVTWDDCQQFIEKLNRLEAEKGWVYRLPKEIEWEYACRGGPMVDMQNSAFDYYVAEPTNTLLPVQAQISGGEYLNPVDARRTCKVGSFAPNTLGLHDMHGNLCEWCADTSTTEEGDLGFAIRGGSWNGTFEFITAALRPTRVSSNMSQSHGLRLVRVPADGTRLANTNSIGMEFVNVPRGKSWLGGGKDRLGDKEVEIPADFQLGKHEVTQEQWEKVMGENPSYFSRTGVGMDEVKDISDAELKRFPVDSVTWDQCQHFVEKLNRLESEKSWLYRLPKEIEWEYACRGGPMTDIMTSAFDYYVAQPSNTLLPGQAQISGGTFPNPIDARRTCRVGSFAPNTLGLHDMHGNLWEWCADSGTTDEGNPGFVNRGSSWDGTFEFATVVNRAIRVPSNMSQSHGLRLVRVPAPHQ